MLREISIKGAREHNLKSIDVTMPRDALNVITGLSGSGKSSLAFDTIYAEGQRRYVESLSAYARQFLELMQKPDVDHIEGLSPAISIEQKTTSRNPRSTVGTVTEIYDYMRLLWARVGTPYSPATGLPIETQQVAQMVDRTAALPEGTRIYLLAPIVRGRKGEYRKEFAELGRQGFQRVKVDDAFYEIDDVPALDKKYKHDIDVVVDRLVVREGLETRLADSFETALRLADGLAVVELADAPSPSRPSDGRTDPSLSHEGERDSDPSAPSSPSPLMGEGRGGGDTTAAALGVSEAPMPYLAEAVPDETLSDVRKGGGKADRPPELMRGSQASGGERPAFEGPDKRLIFSQRFACPVSGFTIPEIEPRLFSFNSPHGACPACDGLGRTLDFDPGLVVPDTSLSLAGGAIKPWSRSDAPYYRQTLEALARAYGFSMNAPWKELGEDDRNRLLYGTNGEPVAFAYDDGTRRYEVNKPFEGVIGNIARRWRETESAWMREELSKFQTAHVCEACGGYRVKEQTRAVKIDGRHIGEVAAMSVKEAHAWFDALPAKLSTSEGQIAERVLKELGERLGFLVNVGLEYLTLARSSRTLSGGESQRIRLASQIGSGLTGVLYVLDEPSIGLHQRDNARLLETLKRLRDIGNTVIVVEHDEEAIRCADHVIDMGPGAGEHGGEVVAEGTPEDIATSAKSLTGQYLSRAREVPLPPARRPGKKGQSLTVSGASGNNLKAVTASIPLGTLTCITGVSGSGKSTLIIETLYKAVARKLNGARALPGAHDEIKGLEFIDKVVDIDQSPIGRTPRSNPATYTGTFTPIRDWFAGLPEAGTRGYKPGRFSFNVKGGRCEACQGDGVIKIEMHFLPDVYVECDTCHGKRYNRETLEIRFKNKSIADVLDMTVEEGREFFRAVPSIRDKLEMLMRVGLGYIKVGQAATTLSGGEAQRVKLAKELSKRSTGKTLYILDEPTTGLHFEDVRHLLEVLQALVDQGNTVVVIEHNLDVIKSADWLIDLGPEGGDGGGEIVAAGTPEDVAKAKASYTGQFLKPLLARHKKGKQKAAE